MADLEQHRKRAASELGQCQGLEQEDDDGVHGGRMKPLSSLLMTSADKRLVPSTPLQVQPSTRQKTKARYNTGSPNDGKRCVSIQMKGMHSRSRRCKSFNLKRHRAIKRKLSASTTNQTKEMPTSNTRDAQCKPTNAKDVGSALHALVKALKPTLNLHESFKELAAPVAHKKKHLNVAIRQAIELPSGYINTAKNRKNLFFETNSFRGSNSKAVDSAAKQFSKPLPYTMTASSLLPADIVYDDCKSKNIDVDFTTVADFVSECEQTQLRYANNSGSSSGAYARLGKIMVKDESASKSFYSADSKMIWTHFFKDRASDASDLGLVKAGSCHDLKEVETVKQRSVLNPGIIIRPRDRKQVHEALAAFIGAPITIVPSPQKLQVQGENIVQILDEGPAKRRRTTALEMKPAQCFSSKVPLMGVGTLAENVHNERCSCKYVATDSTIANNCSLEAFERKSDAMSFYELENQVRKLERQSNTNWTCDQNISRKERLANVAACWLDLLHLDIDGRLSALKQSRRRIQKVVSSGRLRTEVPCPEDLVKTAIRCNVGAGSKGGNEMADWRPAFLNMDAVLQSEGTKLDNRLRQIHEMQSQCQMSRLSSLILN